MITEKSLGLKQIEKKSIVDTILKKKKLKTKKAIKKFKETNKTLMTP